jgi:hypothetical protein
VATGDIIWNIRAFTQIFRQAYLALLCEIRWRAAYRLSGTERLLYGWMPGCCRYGPRGRSEAEPNPGHRRAGTAV